MAGDATMLFDPDLHTATVCLITVGVVALLAALERFRGLGPGAMRHAGPEPDGSAENGAGTA
jgi:hypothetical protein